MKRFKLKLDRDFATGTVKTKLFVRDEETNELKPIHVRTEQDIEDNVPFRSFVKLLILVSKFWASKSAQGTSKTRSCGMTL